MCISYVQFFIDRLLLLVSLWCTVECLERPLFSSVFGLRSARGGSSSSGVFGGFLGLRVQGYPFSNTVQGMQGLPVPLRSDAVSTRGISS